MVSPKLFSNVLSIIYNLKLFFAEISSIASIASTHPMLTQDPSESIPQLVGTLDDEDPVVVLESLHLLERAVKKDNYNERFFNAMVQSQDLISAIVKAISNAIPAMIAAEEQIRNGPAQAGMAHENLVSAQKRARIATDILRAMANQPMMHKANRVNACSRIVSAGMNISCLNNLRPHLKQYEFQIKRIYIT